MGHVGEKKELRLIIEDNVKKLFKYPKKYQYKAIQCLFLAKTDDYEEIKPNVRLNDDIYFLLHLCKQNAEDFHPCVLYLDYFEKEFKVKYNSEKKKEVS